MSPVSARVLVIPHFKLQNVFVKIDKCICWNWQMYLLKLTNVFVEIGKCICLNWKMYLFKFQNVFVKIKKKDICLFIERVKWALWQGPCLNMCTCLPLSLSLSLSLARRKESEMSQSWPFHPIWPNWDTFLQFWTTSFDTVRFILFSTVSVNGSQQIIF